MKFYSGIGPRKTPAVVQGVMTDIARQLVPTGWCCRSGHATGADQAFERGAINKQIFLPWEGFNGAYSNNLDAGVRSIDAAQLEIARRHYEMDPQFNEKPDWDDLQPRTMHLLCRNVPVILGENLDSPSVCVITWLPFKGYNGGTAHALRIASTYSIPVFNIGEREDQNAMCKFILNVENRKAAA